MNMRVKCNCEILLKCLIYCWLLANFRVTSGLRKCELCGNNESISKSDRSTEDEDNDDEDDVGSAIEESIRNIGTAGFIGIIVGAAAILVIVPLLYCFLCGWLCFNKKMTKRKQAKLIKKRASQVDFQPQNRDYILRVEEDRPNIEDYLNRKLSLHSLNENRGSNNFPPYYNEQSGRSGTRHGSLISYISSRKNSGGRYSIGSGGGGGGRLSIWSDYSGEAVNKEFSQPVDFSHVLYYYT